MSEKPFRRLIEDQVHLRSNWTDAAILNELRTMSVLPDEYLEEHGEQNPVWGEPDAQNQLISYLALADLIAQRKLRDGAPLLLQKASYGDMGETMRGLRHRLEAIFNPDWEGLADICIQASQYPQRGARLWAVNELGILRDKRSIPILLDALSDSAVLVWRASLHSLHSLCHWRPETKQEVVLGLHQRLAQLSESRSALLNLLAMLEKDV